MTAQGPRITRPLDIFYPILPDSGWIARLVPLGVRTVQLRLKSDDRARVRAEVAASLAVTRAHDCLLVVNDDWREAIELGADAVHLGQEDLATADLASIRAAGLALGISTHDEAELATALAARPHSVALGPIYETKLKAMPWAPQGLDRIGAWKARIGDLPLTAIGGITLDRAHGVRTAGAQSVAVITDIVTHASPEDRTRAWLDWAHGVRAATRTTAR